jgi:hypothetical protein
VKTVLIVAALVIAIFVWIALGMKNQLHKSSTPPASSDAPKPAPGDVYLGLRSRILQSSRKQLGLPNTSSSTQPWGILMDWGLPHGSATVVALSDGNASVYLSNGGGYIGGQSHDTIRKAAQKTVVVANEVEPQMHATTSYPLPRPGEVAFYALTDSGVFTASALEDDLKNGHSPLSKLANAAQEVITQYRLIQDGK